jgi:hypothetical protein
VSKKQFFKNHKLHGHYRGLLWKPSCILQPKKALISGFFALEPGISITRVSKKQFSKWSVNTAANRAGAQAGKRMANNGISVKGVRDINWQTIDTEPAIEQYTVISGLCPARA